MSPVRGSASGEVRGAFDSANGIGGGKAKDADGVTAGQRLVRGANLALRAHDQWLPRRVGATTAARPAEAGSTQRSSRKVPATEPQPMSAVSL